MISSLLRPVISRLPSLLVEAPEVARAEPAVVAQRLGGRVGPLPVAAEDLRAAQQDLARRRRGAARSRAAASPRGRAAAGRRRGSRRRGPPRCCRSARAGPAPAARRSARPARATAARSRRPPGAARRSRPRRCPPTRRGARTSRARRTARSPARAAIDAHSAAGSKRPATTAREPASSVTLTPLRPCWCESGSAWTRTSSALQRHASIAPRIEASTLAWRERHALGPAGGAGGVGEHRRPRVGLGRDGARLQGVRQRGQAVARAVDRHDGRHAAGALEPLARVRGRRTPRPAARRRAGGASSSAVSAASHGIAVAPARSVPR